MRLVIFGATGTMGVLLARQFLAIYPSCTLVLHMRCAAKLPPDLADDPCVVTIEAQLDDMDNLAKAMEGVDAVIIALGPTGRKGPFYPSNTPIAAAYARIIAQMRAHGVCRLIALTTPSVRDPADQFSLPVVFLRRTFAALAPNVVKDIRAIGAVVRDQGDLDWTLVRLALHRESDSEAGNPSEVIAGYVGDGKTRVMSSRLGAATFVIQELEKREWIRKAPMLSAP
ncbi:NAD(P)-binding protein [Mycena rosella]|uniref:NAD(P)-binding protein n=1 Tax=Mycena rosella TaxID=1033263 RepID=A0AAD7GN45_MYCRO|nr:NAD(P)-binding protein [Mycena rosella]